MGIPNILTLLRIFLTPLYAIVFFSNSKYNLYYATLIFFIAGITDVLDGTIARKYNIITKWGTFFDPFADKLMLLTALSCLTAAHIIPVWIIITIAIKEILLVISGYTVFRKGTLIPSNKFGKAASALFSVSMLILVLNQKLGIYIMYISVLAAIIALFSYLKTIFQKLNQLNRQ